MELIKTVRPILTESEVKAINTTCDILETICNECAEIGCEVACPFNRICNRINFPPHNVLMDIADIIIPDEVTGRGDL